MTYTWGPWYVCCQATNRINPGILADDDAFAEQVANVSVALMSHVGRLQNDLEQAAAMQVGRHHEYSVQMMSSSMLPPYHNFI